jgi:hypothetical protein
MNEINNQIKFNLPNIKADVKKPEGKNEIKPGPNGAAAKSKAGETSAEQTKIINSAVQQTLLNAPSLNQSNFTAGKNATESRKQLEELSKAPDAPDALDNQSAKKAPPQPESKTEAADIQKQIIRDALSNLSKLAKVADRGISPDELNRAAELFTGVLESTANNLENTPINIGNAPKVQVLTAFKDVATVNKGNIEN